MEVVYVARRGRNRRGVRYGRKFRTKAGRVGRYVYKYGRRVGFEALRHARRGAGRYVADRTYRSMRKRWRY
jgi:heterodisulfide reductase subunit C